VNKSQDTKKWRAAITVDLTPINGYGDELPGSEVSYTIHINGSLLEVMQKLTKLEE
jgi:hypothetical protein